MTSDRFMVIGIRPCTITREKGEKGETKLGLEASVTRKSTDSRRLRCCFERNVCTYAFFLSDSIADMLCLLTSRGLHGLLLVV